MKDLPTTAHKDNPIISCNATLVQHCGIIPTIDLMASQRNPSVFKKAKVGLPITRVTAETETCDTVRLWGGKPTV
jgi:hypothetical protein